MKGCAVFQGYRRFCGSCGFNRSIHRRWRVLDGGEQQEETTMSALAIEATEAVSAERKASVIDAMHVLLLADPGAAITVQVTDAVRWQEVKATIRPAAVRLAYVDGLRVSESFICRVGDIVYHLTGPAFFKTPAQHEQMLDDRIALDPFREPEVG